MDFKNSDIANGMELTSLIGADASASLEGAALLQMAIQSGNIMPLTADGQLVLPAGVGLDDIKAVGRDLIIQMPDGTQMIVPDGAIFVPQIVVEGVAIPALNFAALLTGQEPQPAAGLPQSSGGNFADAVGDIGDPFALGDLLPPTALAFPDPELQEVVPGLIDRDPDVVIQDGGPASRDVVDNVGEAGLPGTRTSGVVETPGSAAGNGSDSTTGTIFLTSPDGIASIIINGVVVTGAAGQQIVSPRGVMTLGAQNGDQIAYTYRLTDNTSGDATTDVFLVSLTDPDGDVATARLTINIADDVPTARNDIDSLAGGTFGPELGNVLTGAGTISGLAGADTLGADGAAISGFRAGASGSFAAVGSNIAGQYGTLTLGANGSYSYVRNGNTPGGVTDVFTYQLTDTDGDAATATLTINIGDAPNRITFIPDIGDGTIVREPHLPTRGSEPSGSQFDGNAEATSGTITFNSPDGVGNVTVAGVVLTPGALPQLVSSNATGSLVVTGYNYNPVTGIGSITYVYTLNDNTLNTNGESLGFPIVVTDLDGDVASGSLTIKIEDDAPLAVNDSATQQAENAPVSVNIFVNDTSGADGVNLASGVAVVAGSLTGAGALAYNNNGSFTYTPALGEEGVVTFQYIITDGDGDRSTATVTISLLKDSLPSVDVRGENVVAEAGLASGSDAASNSETTDGRIAIATGGDALASLVINNVNVTAGGTVTGASGTLSVSVSQGVYSYSYTLTDNTSGDATTDSFNVIVTDSDGDSAQDTLVIAIQDDTPSAADDTDNIAAGAYGPVTGNVITDAEGDGGADTQGADGAAVTAVTGSVAGSIGGTTAGTYGVLTLNADGSYSYARNAGTAGGVSDVFTYTLRDGDGDIAIATLTIRIADSPTTLDVPAAGEAGTLVDEAGLASGSDANSTGETANGSIAFTAPDGPASVTLDGQAVTSVGQSFAGNFGILTVTSIANGAIGYSYTLTTITSGDTIFDDFAEVVTDQDGDTKAGTLVIDIIDDVPTARADIDSVTEDGPTVADGNVLTGTNVADANTTDGVADTSGADGALVTAISFGATNGTVGSALGGAYGALTINANGSYSYALSNANAAVQGLDGDDSLTEIFTYTATDGDGDTSTTTLTVTINGSDDPITINGLSVSGPDLIVDEDDLVDGSSPDALALTRTGSFTVNGVDGIASIKIGGTETFVGQTVINAFGTFTITSLSAPANGSATSITVGYSYVLTDNGAHANANGENFITETFSVAVTDTDGSTDTDQVEVQIIDDVPTAANDSDTIAAGSNVSAVGNVITDAELDGGKDTAGADTVIVTAITGAAAGTVGGTTAGTYGVLTLNANGSYSYARNDGTPGDVQDVFTYTITDSDGDTSSATLTINILDDRPIVGTNATVLLDDDALSGGNDGGTGDDADALNVTGTLSGSGGDGALTFAYQLTGAPAGFSYVAGANGSVLVQQAGTTVLTITLNSGMGAYAVTQNAPIVHAAGDNENNAPFTLNYTVTDVDGDAANGTLVVNVDDDTPTARADIDSVTEGGSATGNVLTGLDTSSGVAGADIAGADSFTAGGGVVGVRAAGADTTTAVVGGTGSAIAGLYGSLTLGADGSYTYVSTANAVASNQPDVFVYTVRDADGDLSTTTLTLNVANVTVTAADTDALVNEAGLAIGSNPSATSEVFNGTITPAGGVGGYTYTLTTPTNGTYGNLVLNANGTYTYTLTSPFDTSPDANNSTNTEQGRDSFGYRVTDANGNTVTGTILVDIIDDVPTARADIDSVTEDGPTVADGNVLNGANVADANTTDGVADVQGADGASVTAISFGATNGTVGSALAGAYGALTINANGGYSYALNNANAAVQGLDGDDSLTEIFTYTATDGDGDTSTTTLTVTINGSDDPITINGLSVSGPDLIVDEDDLVDGSSPDALALTRTGSFTVSGVDGIASIKIGGAETSLGQTFANAFGTFTITSLSAPVDGSATAITIGYRYVLTDNGAHANANGENFITETFSVAVTDTDGSTDTDQVEVRIIDDVPTAAINKTGQSVSIDESSGNQVDSNDANGPLAVFDDVTNKGDDPDVVGTGAIQFATNSSAIVNFTGTNLGADGGTRVFSLTTSNPSVGVDSGLDVTDGSSIFLFVVESLEGSLVVGRVGATAGEAATGVAAFALSISSTGQVTMAQYLSVKHSNTASKDESVTIVDGALLAVLTATDSDGDTSSASTQIGSLISFQDDAPVITAAENINIQNGGDFAHSGKFAFDVGSDGSQPSNNEIKSVTFSAVVNNVTVHATAPLTEVSETALEATYNFSFTYNTGGSTTATNNGTLVFNKDAGTYTVNLQSAITGISIQSVQSSGQTPAFFDYPLAPVGPSGDVGDGIAVVEIATDFFIQFTGQSNVTTPNADFGDDDLWSGGAQSEVKISSTAIGVFGNSVQSPDVLDYNFYKTDPAANLGAPTASAGTVFIKVAQFNGAEDFVVTLKLADPNALGTVIQRTFIVDGNDVLTTTPAGYPALGTNQGYIIFEPNDYQSLVNVPDNYQVVGMQLRSSSEGVQSSAGEVYNFDGAIGAADVTARSFSRAGGGDTGTNDNDVFKIIDIGVVRPSTTNQSAILNFNVTITDGDGDELSQTLVATVNQDADSVTAIVLPPASTTALPVILDGNGDGMVSFLDPTVGVTYDYNNDGVAEATAWVGSGDYILVRDADGNGTVTGTSEFVFGDEGITDMQVLAREYGNVLDANDVDFAKFGVWQDANSNGVTDAGEYRSLSDAGIVSIGLVSDGIAYSAANGSVSVAGQSVYTKADGSTGIVADAAFAKGGALSVVSRSSDQIRTSNATTSVIAAALVGLSVAENVVAAPNGNLGKLGAVASEASANGNGEVSSASTSEASVVSTLAFQPTQEFGQRTNDVGSSLRPSEDAGVARGLQDAPMAERSAVLEDKADPVSDDQSNFAGAFGGGDQVMHSMLDITAFSASAGAGESAALPIPIADTLREAMPDLILDRLIDAFTAALGAPANDTGGGANDSALLAGILNQGVDAFQLAAMASNDLTSAHHYDMAMISHG